MNVDTVKFRPMPVQYYETTAYCNFSLTVSSGLTFIVMDL